MEKFDDRIDGFSVQEYEALSQAYKQAGESQNGVLIENVKYMDARENAVSEGEVKPFGEDDFQYSGVGVQEVVEPQQNYDVVAPTPQVSYVGLTDTEKRWLNDLVQDLRQYYNDDFGLCEYLHEEITQVERPLFYFVSKNKILAKIVNLLCSIFDKSRLNQEVSSLVCELINLSRKVNSK